MAMDRLRRDAARGIADAQFRLGQRYAEYAVGDGVSQAHVEAARLYGLAAAQGDAVAQFNLGFFYSKSKGVAN
jgi:hypothetical protein